VQLNDNGLETLEDPAPEFVAFLRSLPKDASAAQVSNLFVDLIKLVLFGLNTLDGNKTIFF
jgi:hypothetical protein